MEILTKKMACAVRARLGGKMARLRESDWLYLVKILIPHPK